MYFEFWSVYFSFKLSYCSPCVLKHSLPLSVSTARVGGHAISAFFPCEEHMKFPSIYFWKIKVNRITFSKNLRICVCVLYLKARFVKCMELALVFSLTLFILSHSILRYRLFENQWNKSINNEKKWIIQDTVTPDCWWTPLTVTWPQIPSKAKLTVRLNQSGIWP